jgi:hypothetical protein
MVSYLVGRMLVISRDDTHFHAESVLEKSNDISGLWFAEVLLFQTEN